MSELLDGRSTTLPTSDSAAGIGAAGPEAPEIKLVGRHVALQPIRMQDYEALRMLELRAEFVPLWRHQGVTPSPEQWAKDLWTGVLAQFLVINLADHNPVGIVNCYNPDFRHRFAYIAAAKFDLQLRSPLFLEGLAIFLEYVFTIWDFRKLYFESTELTIEQFKSGIGGLFVKEGTLRQHRYFAGRYWDQHILAMYREAWDDVAVWVRRYL
jgi:hypothetical protein